MKVMELPGSLVHPAVPGTRPFTVEDLWKIPRVGAAVPSHDSISLAVPVTTYTPPTARSERAESEVASCTRLWLVPVSRRLGEDPRPLTSADAIAGNPCWAPDDDRIAFTRKSRGDDDATPQLFVLRLDGGEPEQVTDLPLGVFDARWLPDGSGLVIASKLIKGHLTIEETRRESERRRNDPVKAYATEDRVYRFWDTWLSSGEVPHLFHLDLAGGVLRDLIPQSEGWFDPMEPAGQFDVSPSGDEVAFGMFVHNRQRNEIESHVFRVPFDGGGVECLTGDTPANSMRPRYTPDGAAIVYGRTEDRYFYADRPRLYRFKRATGEHDAWCTDWDQTPMQWELTAGGTLIFVAEHRARTHLYTLAPNEPEPRLLAEGGTLGAPRPAIDGIYLQSHTTQTPPEIYYRPMKGGSLKRVTRFTEDALDGIALGEVREIEVPGAEGVPIQAFLVLPPDHDPTTPAPLVNFVHGGPHGTTDDGFHFRWNVELFAAAGYVTVSPNFHGSTSWGTEFARCIQGEWADRPYRDTMAVTDALVESGLADPERLAAAGGSYGGYMMAWIAGHTDRFKCIVNHAGVYNTLSMYASDVTQMRARSFGGEPWDDLAAIDTSNPARHTAGMNTPMLVIHGEKDYRVPAVQGLECYGVLKAKGVPARLLYFPDENHWVLKPHNSIRWYEEVLAWLDRWLG